MSEPVRCYSLEKILAGGYVEMACEPTHDIPGLWFILKHKVHGSFRCTDGLWHYFRYADADKAKARDAELSGPLLPSR